MNKILIPYKATKHTRNLWSVVWKPVPHCFRNRQVPNQYFWHLTNNGSQKWQNDYSWRHNSWRLILDRFVLQQNKSVYSLLSHSHSYRWFKLILITYNLLLEFWTYAICSSTASCRQILCYRAIDNSLRIVTRLYTWREMYMQDH